jgi:hypothetical protein
LRVNVNELTAIENVTYKDGIPWYKNKAWKNTLHIKKPNSSF